MGAMLTKAGRNVQPPPCSRGMPDCFEPLSQCPLDVAQPRSGGGQQFGPAFDEIRTSQRRNTEVRLTHRWREMDSNIRFRAEETAIFEPPRIERASFSPCTSRRRHRPALRAAILRRAPKIRTRRRMRGRHSAPIIPDDCPTTSERLGNGASRAMLLMTADFEEPRTKRWRLHGINWGHSCAGAAQKTGPSTIAVVYSKNVGGMNLLNHNGIDVRTREEVDEAYRIVCAEAEQWHLKKISKSHLQHGTYSFFFWDGDDNCWEILTNPEGGYSWLFEQGDQHDKGHLDRNFKRPGVVT